MDDSMNPKFTSSLLALMRLILSPWAPGVHAIILVWCSLLGRKGSKVWAMSLNQTIRVQMKQSWKTNNIMILDRDRIGQYHRFLLNLLLFIRNLALLFGFVEITENLFTRFPHSHGLALPRAPVTSYAQSARRFSPCSACWPATSSATVWWRDTHVSSVVKASTIPLT